MVPLAVLTATTKPPVEVVPRPPAMAPAGLKAKVPPPNDEVSPKPLPNPVEAVV